MIEDNMTSLAGGDERFCRRVGQSSDFVAERTGRVDHDARRGPPPRTALGGADDHPIDGAPAAGEADRWGVVEDDSPEIHSGPNQVDVEPGVVELSVVVNDAATQAVGTYCRQAAYDVLGGDDP